jgi:hypothetical protein
MLANRFARSNIKQRIVKDIMLLTHANIALGRKLFANVLWLTEGGNFETPTYQIKIMFNRSRWTKKSTNTPLFNIKC